MNYAKKHIAHCCYTIYTYNYESVRISRACVFYKYRLILRNYAKGHNYTYNAHSCPIVLSV